jgi:hypothetical protein
VSRYPLPDGSAYSSDGVVFPIIYHVYWSPDAAYAVIQNGGDYEQQCEVIDIARARVAGPGWIRATDADTQCSSEWATPRSFTAVIAYHPGDRGSPRRETITVTVDPFEIRGPDGTVRWPRPGAQ